MAYFHKLTVIGRLVGKPTFRTFTNGGGVAKFGLPIDFTRRKKNEATGQWEGESFIIDVDAFDRENGLKLAQMLKERNERGLFDKGSQVYVEGRLKPNEYTDKNGVKVFKPVLVVDQIQFLDPVPPGTYDGGEGAGMSRATGSSYRSATPPKAVDHGDYEEAHSAPPASSPEEDIPF